MSGWAGFSDAELRRLQQNNNSQTIPVPVSTRGRKSAMTRSRQQIQREQALLRSESNPLSPGQQLSSTATQTTKETKTQDKTESMGDKETNQECGPGSSSKVESSSELNGKMSEEKELSEKEEETPVLKELEKQEVEIRDRSRLEQLQIEQKEMEEKNKKKKALLAKTIAEKSKQTRAETIKLQRIQKELQTLDDMVSNDISILRGKIEQASWDYNTARKRYEKAETEFVVAKLELHKKTELKEQLTEHLCAIIQQNEVRKAVKLEELMAQLQLQTEEETDSNRGEEREKQREGERGEGVHESEQEKEREGEKETEQNEKGSDATGTHDSTTTAN